MIKVYSLKVLALLLIMLIFPGTGITVEKSTATRVLNLDEFIRTATERDTEFEEILINRLFLNYEKALRLPPGDIVLDVRAQYNFYPDQDRGRPQTAFGLSKLFPKWGTRVSADYAVTPSATGGVDTSAASFTLAQPIAENAFGRSTRLLDKIVGLEIDIARHQIVEAYEDYLALLTSAYYDWYEAYESLKISQSAHKTNLTLFENMRSRQKSRIALPIDVNKVQLQVLAKQERVLEFTERYKNRTNIVERSIREDLKNTIPASPVIPDIPSDFLDRWYDEFKSTSRTYRVLDMLEKKSLLDLKREADDLLPSLDVLFGLEAEGNTDGLKNREDSSFAGVQLSWPLPDARARAEKRVALINRDKTQLSNSNVRYRLFTRLKNLALQIEREQELIKIGDEKIKLSQSVLRDESENYSFGRASLNDYIQAVNSQDTNRFEKISHEVLFRQLVLEFRRLTDVLVGPDQEIVKNRP